MIASLISEIVEAVVGTAFSAVLKFLGLEEFAELVGGIFSLGCILVGFTMWWLSH